MLECTQSLLETVKETHQPILLRTLLSNLLYIHPYEAQNKIPFTIEEYTTLLNDLHAYIQGPYLSSPTHDVILSKQGFLHVLAMHHWHVVSFLPKRPFSAAGRLPSRSRLHSGLFRRFETPHSGSQLFRRDSCAIRRARTSPFFSRRNARHTSSRPTDDDVPRHDPSLPLAGIPAGHHLLPSLLFQRDFELLLERFLRAVTAVPKFPDSRVRGSTAFPSISHSTCW